MEYALRQKEELSISTVVTVTRCHKPRLNTSMYIKTNCLMPSMWLVVVG